MLWYTLGPPRGLSALLNCSHIMLILQLRGILKAPATSNYNTNICPISQMPTVHYTVHWICPLIFLLYIKIIFFYNIIYTHLFFMVFLLCAHKCPETYGIIIYYIFEFIKNIFRIFYFSLGTLGTRLYKNIIFYNIRPKTIIKISAQTSAQIDHTPMATQLPLWALLIKYII